MLRVFFSDEGIFGCMGLLACEDACPKELPLQDQLTILRRKAEEDVKDRYEFYKKMAAE